MFESELLYFCSNDCCISSCNISDVDVEGDGNGGFNLVVVFVAVSGCSNWTASLIDVSLPAGVTCDRSSLALIVNDKTPTPAAVGLYRFF
jgi:hypothetical protein